MKMARALAVGVLVAGPFAMSTLACDPPSPSISCASIPTIPNSDAGIWQIRAHGSTCPTARELALAWYQHAAGRPFVWNSVWNCTGAVPVARQLGNDVWCNGPGGAVVTFTAV